MASLGKAYIEVHADTRPFGRELQADIDKYLASAQKQMDVGGQKLGKQFSESFAPEARKGLDTVSKDFKKAGTVIDKVTKETGSKVRKNIKKGLDDADKDTRNWFTRLTSYFSAWALNSVTNFQGFASGAQKAFASATDSGAAFVGIVALITAAVLALLPLASALVGVLVFGVGGAIGALVVALAPLLLAFKQLSNYFPLLSKNTADFNKGLKDVPKNLQPILTVLYELKKTFTSLPLGDFFKQLVPPLQELNKIWSSRKFRDAFSQIASDIGRIVADIIYMFDTKDAQSAFLLFFQTVHQILGYVSQDAIFFFGALFKIFNNPAVQHAVLQIFIIINEIVIKFADWLKQVSSDGSLDRFLDLAFQTFGLLLVLVQEMLKLFTVVLTPDTMSALNIFLGSIVASLELMIGYFQTQAGQNFLHDLIVGFSFLVVILDAIILAMAAIDLAVRIAGAIFEGFWKGIQKGASLAMKVAVAQINVVIKALNHLISLVDKLGFHISQIPLINLNKNSSAAKKAAQAIAGANNVSGPQTGTQPGTGGFYQGLAAGGIVTSPQITLIGEQSRPEVVIPLTKPARARQLADQSGLTQMLGGTQMVYVRVDLDGQPFRDYTAAAMDAAGDELLTGPRS